MRRLLAPVVLVERERSLLFYFVADAEAWEYWVGIQRVH